MNNLIVKGSGGSYLTSSVINNNIPASTSTTILRISLHPVVETSSVIETVQPMVVQPQSVVVQPQSVVVQPVHIVKEEKADDSRMFEALLREKQDEIELFRSKCQHFEAHIKRLQEREKVIIELEAILRDKDQRSNKLASEISDLERYCRELESKLRERDQKLKFLEEELNKPVDTTRWEIVLREKEQRIIFLEEELRKPVDSTRWELVIRERESEIESWKTRCVRVESQVNKYLYYFFLI